MIDIQTVTTVVLYGEHPVWAHNLAGQHPTKFTNRCSTVRGAPRRATCRYRVYNGRAGARKLLLSIRLDCVIKKSRRKNRVYEDGSGWVRYDGTRMVFIHNGTF